MTYRGTVKNGVVVFDEQISVPDGTIVQIELLTMTPRKTLADQFADVIGSVPDLPPDMARQHDHYLHGTPKS